MAEPTTPAHHVGAALAAAITAPRPDPAALLWSLAAARAAAGAGYRDEVGEGAATSPTVAEVTAALIDAQGGPATPDVGGWLAAALEAASRCDATAADGDHEGAAEYARTASARAALVGWPVLDAAAQLLSAAGDDWADPGPAAVTAVRLAAAIGWRDPMGYGHQCPVCDHDRGHEGGGCDDAAGVCGCPCGGYGDPLALAAFGAWLTEWSAGTALLVTTCEAGRAS